MRDPGAPRRNPLFAVDGAAARAPEPEEPVLEEGPTFEDPGPDESDAASSAANVGDAARAACALFPTDVASALLGNLAEASPEAMEHLVIAGRELMAAARVILEAAERAVEQAAAGSVADDPAGTSDTEGAFDAPASAPRRHGRVHKIDLA